MIRPKACHRLWICSGLLMLATVSGAQKPASDTEAGRDRRQLAAQMKSSEVDMALRLTAAKTLLEQGVQPEATQARELVLEVYEGTRLHFETPAQPTGLPFVTLHYGGAAELIAALAAIDDDQARVYLREWLEKYPLNVYEGNQILDYLLEKPVDADLESMMDYAAKQLDGEPGLQVGLMERLVAASLLRDGERLRRFVQPLRDRLVDPSAREASLPLDTELLARMDKLLQLADELEAAARSQGARLSPAHDNGTESGSSVLSEN